MSFQTLHWGGRDIDIEYVWLEPALSPGPSPAGGRGAGGEGAPKGRERVPIVFLHEGLGSLAMWRDFPKPYAAHWACAAWCIRARAMAAPRRVLPMKHGVWILCTAKPMRSCPPCSMP